MARHQAPAVDEITERWPADGAAERTDRPRQVGPLRCRTTSPPPHIDVLEQAIDYRVPVEGANFLALNLRGDTGDPDQQLIDS